MLSTLQLGILILWLLLLLQFFAIFLFYRNRWVYPINARCPRVAIIMNILAIAYATLLFVSNFWIISCQLNKWIQFFVLTYEQFCLNYRTTSLLFSYEITRNITELKDHKNLADWKANWFTLHRHWIQDKFMLRVLLYRSLIVLFFIIVLTAAFPTVRYPPCDSKFDSILQYLLMTFLTFDFIYLFVVAGKMWKYPNDAFGIKSEFKLYAASPFVLLIIFFLLRGFIIDMFTYLPLIIVIETHVIPIISIDRPLFNSWKIQRRESKEALAEAMQLKTFLKRPEAMRAFSEYLKTEFSSENLLFWCEVQNFKKLATTAKNDITQAKIYAIQMYEKFLKLDAPCLLNLPAEISKGTCRAIEKIGGFEVNLPGTKNEEGIALDVVGSDENIYQIFDLAEEEIYRLMSSDSFYRFQKTTTFEQIKSVFKNNPPSKGSHHSNPNESIDQILHQSLHGSRDKKMIEEEVSVNASSHISLLQPRGVSSSPYLVGPDELEPIQSPSKLNPTRKLTQQMESHNVLENLRALVSHESPESPESPTLPESPVVVSRNYITPNTPSGNDHHGEANDNNGEPIDR